ncbi:MAG: Fic family protein [Bryobacteraceae bacterium]
MAPTSPPQFVPRGIIFRDADEKLRLETRNGVIQAEFVFHTVSSWQPGKLIEPPILLELQRLATNQIYRCAGYFRDGEVTLGVDHQPPDHKEVPRLVDEMCFYVNEQWMQRRALHLAAYVMWRLNWIHPFFGGNGRTARAFSHLILCLRLGFTPPATEKNIPELIDEDPDPYYHALRAADAALLNTQQIDVTEMEALLSSLLAKQLVAIHVLATGQPAPF